MRPKPCRLALYSALRWRVAQKLALQWSPQQISGWLKQEFPTHQDMRISHEAIYRSLFIQTRGGASLRVILTRLLCGSINVRERPWASKRQPIDCKRCCTDRLNAHSQSRHSLTRLARQLWANMRQNAPQQSIASLRARNDESSPVGGVDCKTWAHRYAPWRSLRRKSTKAVSAGRIWRRLG